MRLSLERKITLGFATASVVLLLVSAVAWWNASRFQGTHYWVEHSREVLTHLEQATSSVLAMQSSARGFVLTGSDEVLLPFDAGAPQLAHNLARIRQLTSGNARQQARLARLEPLAVQAREIMLGRIEARRARGLDAAGETAAYLDGQRVVEEIRAVVREMVAEERRLLDDRLDRNNQAGRLTFFAIAGVTLVAIALSTVAAILLRRDLTRRRQAETALQESFSRVEDLYNNAPCGYHSVDRTGLVLAINDTALTWLGYTRAEVVGRMNFADLLSPGSAPYFPARFEHFKCVGAVQNVEYEWLRKDGTVFPVLLNATVIYDEAGNFLASRATVFDVTLRKRAEEERDRVFTLSRDLLSIAKFDGFFTRVNPAWELTLGFTPEELLAQPQIAHVHPEDRARMEHLLSRLIAGEDRVDLDTRLVCKDGSFRWVHWSARAAPAEKLIYASARDITDRKQADERIQRLHADLTARAAQLEAANRELESFSYSVSHDLRAPLRHIDGFAGMLSKRAVVGLDDESRRYLATISKSAKQMGRLIDDLLGFSRISRVPLRIAPVDHHRLVSEVIADGQYETAQRPIVWDLTPLPKCPADSAMLRQVWVNLIENVVKYSGKKSESHIAIAGQADVAAGEYVYSVRDNGVGFNMAYADKLFGVFQRLHSPADFEGTGIGLANVRRIITRHGGRTWAEGREDEGAVFYFSIPFHVSTGPAQS